MKFKSFNIFFIILFLLSAGLQYNDPDPYVWMPIYVSGALLCYLSITGKYFQNIFMTCLLLYAAYASFLFFDENGVLSWYYAHNAENIAQTMKATKPWIEETREFFGLMILIFVVTVNMIWLEGKQEKTITAAPDV